MRLLVVGQVPPPYHGSNVMAKTLRVALEKLGHHVVFIDKSFSRNISEVRKTSLRKIMHILPLVANVATNLRRNRFELCVYFISNSAASFLVDALILWILRIHQSPYILRFGAKGFSRLEGQNLVLRLLVSVTLKKSLGGIVKANTLKSDINRYIPDDRLLAIPNCIADSKPVKIRAKSGEPVQILFLSNLMPAKGPMQFLKAAAIVLRKKVRVRFVLAGEKWRDDYDRQLHRYIEENGLKAHVSIPGGVYGHDKDRLFAASHIFVFPTLDETFGLVNIEAMQAGLPVISSPEGAIPEIIEDGVTGFIVNPYDPNAIADRICQLIDDPIRCETMGKHGRKRFEKEFTIEAYTSHWGHVLETVKQKMTH